MLTNINFLQSKPEFEVFSYANRAFDKHKKLSSDSKIKSSAKTILSTLTIFSSTVADLMTVSSRFANHLKTLNDYNQSFNLRRPLSKVNRYFKKLNYKLGKLDVRELDYKPFSLTSRLIVELEKIPRSSKVKKAILKMVSIAAAQFAVIVDIITLPARHYRYLKVVAKNKERIVRLNNVAQILTLFSTFFIIKNANNYYIDHLYDVRRYSFYYSSSAIATLELINIYFAVKLYNTINDLAEAENNYMVLLSQNNSLKKRLDRQEQENSTVKPVEYGKVPPGYIMISEEGNCHVGCQICLTEDFQGIEIPVTHLRKDKGYFGEPCAIFCKECIDEWLRKDGSCTCPQCNQLITKNSLRYVEDKPSRDVRIARHFAVI